MLQKETKFRSVSKYAYPWTDYKDKEPWREQLPGDPYSDFQSFNRMNCISTWLTIEVIRQDTIFMKITLMYEHLPEYSPEKN